jgi:dipeptidyl-peptidase 4
MSFSVTPRRQRARLGFPRTATALLTAFLCVSAIAADNERSASPNYNQAARFSAANLRPFLYDTAVNPVWIGKTDNFWYSYRTNSGSNYYRVNPKLGVKEPLFDRDKLATQLSAMVQKPLEPGLLPLTRITLNDEGTKLKFVVDDFQYEYDLNAETLAKLGKAPPAPPQQFAGGPGQRGQFQQRRDQEQQDQQRQEQQKQDEQRQNDQDQQRQNDDQQRQNDAQAKGARQGRGGADYHNYSPDHKNFVYVQKFNLYYADEGKESDAIALTNDGTEDYGFGFGGMGGGGQGRGVNNTNATALAADPNRKLRAPATWAADSKAFYVTRADSRGVKDLWVINSLAEPRPTLEKYKYPVPGEEATRKTELYVYARDSKKLTRVQPKWKDESYTNIHWSRKADELRFVRRDRLVRHVELCSLNINSGESKCLISEGFENANIAFQPARYLDDSDEMIWWSERSGWGHYYLYDREGHLKNAVTSGSFRASNIVEVDTKNRLLYFYGNGREPGENIYLQHLYCVHFDGTGLTLMDPGPANHRSTLSPSRQYLVDNCSRVDQAPCSILRHADGREVMTLERADLSKLVETGWKLPETFVVKAADGVTDLYGNLWKPFDFDAKKKYPIIVHVYPGPQQEGTTHTFSAVSGEQQLAQMGFIVIQVGHRGGTPTRSKAYHSFGYFNLRDYGLADKKAAIEQLASRHPYIDIDRVGIYGHSGGGFMTAAALLQKPYNEFFKVGVATSGNHDNNIYGYTWAETYHGLREVVINAKSKDQAADKSRADSSSQSTGQGRSAQDQTLDGADDDLISMDRAEVEEVVSDRAEDDAVPRLDEITADDKKDAETKSDDKKLEDKKLEDKKVEETKLEDKKLEDKKLEDKKLEDKKLEDKKLEDKKTHVKTVDDVKVGDKKAEDKKSDDKKDAETKAEDKKSDDKKAEDKKTDVKTVDDVKVGDKKAEDKKSDDKKAEDKKSDDKKSDDKKAEDKKSDDKKAEDKKDEDKKSDDKKAEDKKAEDKKEAEKKEAEEKKTKFEIHVPTNAELAQNLKGRLLLVHGELDNNVHPANTLRLVDALIKANKRFDMLYLPGKRHAYADYQPYINQRMMEYFAEHLLGDYQPGADINDKAPPSARR